MEAKLALGVSEASEAIFFPQNIPEYEDFNEARTEPNSARLGKIKFSPHQKRSRSFGRDRELMKYDKGILSLHPPRKRSRSAGRSKESYDDARSLGTSGRNNSLLKVIYLYPLETLLPVALATILFLIWWKDGSDEPSTPQPACKSNGSKRKPKKGTKTQSSTQPSAVITTPSSTQPSAVVTTQSSTPSPLASTQPQPAVIPTQPQPQPAVIPTQPQPQPAVIPTQPQPPPQHSSSHSSSPEPSDKKVTQPKPTSEPPIQRKTPPPPPPPVPTGNTGQSTDQNTKLAKKHKFDPNFVPWYVTLYRYLCKEDLFTFNKKGGFALQNFSSEMPNIRSKGSRNEVLDKILNQFQTDSTFHGVKDFPGIYERFTRSESKVFEDVLEPEFLIHAVEKLCNMENIGRSVKELTEEELQKYLNNSNTTIPELDPGTVYIYFPSKTEENTMIQHNFRNFWQAFEKACTKDANFMQLVRVTRTQNQQNGQCDHQEMLELHFTEKDINAQFVKMNNKDRSLYIFFKYLPGRPQESV
eukprot:GHVP01067149.1.p1 GENE.GHVP01067149.1~~GHVP01067149.1.p1  ORF type:complete len:542 (+),score=59.25 GHVP01067149.1:50-1627(+)